MRTAYLECATGISGDMTLAALLDAGVEEAAIQRGIASLNLADVQLEVSEVMQGCFRARKVHVAAPHQQAHRHLGDIEKLVTDAGAISPRQKQLALEIFREIARAEAKVHGMSPDQIHFHEVGAVDSIVDIVGAAIGFDLLAADEIVCGPLPTGRGTVRIDHGLCPLPAPGTAELLIGIPLHDLPLQGELTTPTGAAIVRVLADRFGPLPAMTIEGIGCGAGTMEFAERANILRLFVGTAVSTRSVDDVVLLETNLDDVSGEVIGHARQQLLAAGALDVYTIPIQMKKDRPGVILCVLARPEQAESLSEMVFAETGTLGIRRQQIARSLRARQPHTILTAFGPVSGKLAWSAAGVPEFAPEFEACAQLAREQGRPLREIYRAALVAFQQQQPESCPGPLLADAGAANADHGHSHDHDHGHSHDHDHGHSHDHGT